MKTLIIVGHEGMLGQMLVDEFARMGFADDGWVIKGMGRTKIKDFNPSLTIRTIPENTTVINAAGIVKGRDVQAHEMVNTNSLLPHIIAAQQSVKRIIQISTDCVFDGHKQSPYSEANQATPVDIYGRSKLAGELLHENNALTVRTSFIGFGQRGLIRWLLDQPEKANIEGYLNWMWNGLYVRTAAKLLLQLAIESDMSGLLHLEGTVLTKGELLARLAVLLRPDVQVTLVEAPQPRWMLLASNRISGLTVPSWQEQWDELKQDAFDLGLVSLGKSL